MGKKHFIQQALPPSHKGNLHKALGVPQGQPIPQSTLQRAAKEPGKVGQMARFAETLEGMNHGSKKK